MTEHNEPDATAVALLDLDRASTVLRWHDEHGMTLVQVAELGSSWHVPDDASPWFGDADFGASLVRMARQLLGKG